MDQPSIEIDTLRQMLRTFLTERFQIKTHVETREEVQGGAALSASEPTGAISLPEALDRQLGLKLELQKRPMQVLVLS
jgi:hypothetical protein